MCVCVCVCVCVNLKLINRKMCPDWHLLERC